MIHLFLKLTKGFESVSNRNVSACCRLSSVLQQRNYSLKCFSRRPPSPSHSHPSLIVPTSVILHICALRRGRPIIDFSDVTFYNDSLDRMVSQCFEMKPMTAVKNILLGMIGSLSDQSAQRAHRPGVDQLIYTVVDLRKHHMHQTERQVGNTEQQCSTASRVNVVIKECM